MSEDEKKHTGTIGHYDGIGCDPRMETEVSYRDFPWDEVYKDVAKLAGLPLACAVLQLHERVKALEAATSKPRCTCDDAGDGPCPIHGRESALQNRAIIAEGDLKNLRACVAQFAKWMSSLDGGPHPEGSPGYLRDEGFQVCKVLSLIRLRELGLIKE